MTVDIWPAFQSCSDVSVTFSLLMSICNTAFFCSGYFEKGKVWPDKEEMCQISSVG